MTNEVSKTISNDGNNLFDIGPNIENWEFGKPKKNGNNAAHVSLVLCFVFCSEVKTVTSIKWSNPFEKITVRKTLKTVFVENMVLHIAEWKISIKWFGR